MKTLAMKTLAEWYPGDGIVLAGLEAWGAIAVLVFLTWAIERAVARRRAALAGAIWLAALVAVLLVPVLALLGPKVPWRLGMLSQSAAASVLHAEKTVAWEPTTETAPAHGSSPTEAVLQPPAAATTPTAASAVPPTTGRTRRASPATKTPAPAPVSERVQTASTDNGPPTEAADVLHAGATLAIIVWALGSLWLGMRLLHGIFRVRRLWRDARPLDASARSAEVAAASVVPGRCLPRICFSPYVRGPLVAGLLRPRVVLPEALLEEGTPEQIREILVHECAHILRRDPLVRFLQRLAVVLFWVQPLMFLLNRRLDHAREEVCDNHVLEHAEAPDYAGTLLTVAQVCYPIPNLEGYLTMMSSHHNLEHRVAGLLDESRDTATRLRLPQRLAIGTLMLLMLGAISSIGFQGAARAHHDGGSADEKKAPPAAADKTTPAALGKVTGRVVHTADGKPVGGADVRLLRRGTYSGTPPTRRTTANAAGQFTFEGVAPGDYRVWSFYGNLASRTRMYQGDIVKVAADGAAKPVVLKMRSGVTVRVKVIAQTDGKPIAGARVRLIWTDTDRDRYTDSKGEVELPALTSETWHIKASAKDYAAVTRILNLANEQPAFLEMKLAAGGSLEGRVTGEDGKPVPKVGVNVYRGADSGMPLDYVETDADGRYRLDHLHLGQTLSLYVAKLDYLPKRPEFSIDPAQRTARVEVVLKKRPHGGSVYGVVNDSKGKPVAGAEIFNQGGSSNEVRKAKSDAQGKYLLDDVYSDSIGHQLVVRAKGLAPQRVDFRPGPAKQPAEVNVQLEPGHGIKGRVVNEAGKPVPGVWVHFGEGNSPAGMFYGGSATTDAQGRFQFDSLPANASFSFRADGYSQLPNEKLPLDGDKEVVVTVKSQGVIRGRVVDAASGKPLRRFNVSITFSPDRRPDEPAAGLMSSRVSPGEDFVSAEGRFVLKDLIAGMPLQVTVTAPGYRRQVLRRVVAEASGAAERVDIKLSAEDPAKLITIRGKLVNHKGHPVRGADLRLIAAADRPIEREGFPFNWQMIESGQIEQVANVVQVQRLTTGADGSFLFQRVPGDVELELVYWGKGIPPARMDHLESLSAKERTNLAIKALAPARIVGKIDRNAFPRFSSIQLSGMSRFYQAKVAADGKSFTIDDLPPGTYEIQIYGPGVRSANDPNAFQTPVTGRRAVTIAEGTEEKTEMGSGELVQGGS
jgi:beta-lactamase regulating signal transducer with metallopeptidase domain/5-hydroxyisourate hydrolase-like protein (transthyretin family)